MTLKVIDITMVISIASPITPMRFRPLLLKLTMKLTTMNRCKFAFL